MVFCYLFTLGSGSHGQCVKGTLDSKLMAVSGLSQNNVFEKFSELDMRHFRIDKKKTAWLHLHFVCFSSLKQWVSIYFVGVALQI